MSIDQTAGSITVSIWTEGWPVVVRLDVAQGLGEAVSTRLSVEDLHNLRYCCDRAISNLPPAV